MNQYNLDTPTNKAKLMLQQLHILYATITMQTKWNIFSEKSHMIIIGYIVTLQTKITYTCCSILDWYQNFKIAIPMTQSLLFHNYFYKQIISTLCLNRFATITKKIKLCTHIHIFSCVFMYKNWQLKKEYTYELFQ